MPPKPKKQTFKQLQDKWYAKLEKSGFVDIENDRGLKHYSTSLANYRREYSHRNEHWKHTTEYYILAEHFLNEYKFDTKFQRNVWEYHSSGISIRDIVLLFKKVRIKTDRNELHKIIKALKHKMYSMYLEPKQEYRENGDF